MNKKTGKITVKHVYQATSGGLSVGLDLVANQIVGGVTQILSRLLVEQYVYSKTNVMSTDFVSYPILRFKEAPKVTPIVVQRTSDHRVASGAGGDHRFRRRRQRLLRRDRRPPLHGAIHSSPCPSGAQGGRRGLNARLVRRAKQERPLGLSCFAVSWARSGVDACSAPMVDRLKRQRELPGTPGTLLRTEKGRGWRQHFDQR